MGVHVATCGERSVALFELEGICLTGNKQASLSIKGPEVNLGSAVDNLRAVSRVDDGTLCHRCEEPAFREGQIKAVAQAEAFTDGIKHRVTAVFAGTRVNQQVADTEVCPTECPGAVSVIHNAGINVSVVCLKYRGWIVQS